VVEAAGVEPASEKVHRKKATCVSGSLVFVRLLRSRQERGGLARLISAFSSRRKLWTYPAKMTPSRPVQAHGPENGYLIN